MIPCVVLKVLLAAQSNTAELRSCAPTRLPVFGQTLQTTLREKKNLWAKCDEHGELSTANNRMQPAFAGSYKTVGIPFGSRVIRYLPREYPLVKNEFFGDRFVEVIYLRADHDTPCIRMY